MKRTALLIMIITFVSRIIGFGREIVLSYFFGASNISDIYMISLTIPNVIFGLIATGIVTAYIPMQTRILKEAGEEAGAKYTSNFTNIIMIITTILLIIGLVFTEGIVRLFASGFTGSTFRLTVEFTKISLFGMYFAALTSIYSGYLQIRNNYIVPALIGLPLNLFVILTIIIAAKGNIIVLAIGTLIATASQFFLLVPFIKKTKMKYSLTLNFKDKRIVKSLKVALPVIIGTSVTQINILVDRTIASSIVIGGISALNYANRLNLLIQGLFVISIITVLYPLISSHAANNDFEGVKKTLSEAIILIFLFLLPITIGTLLFSYETIVLLYGRGAFDESAINLTSTALFFYGIGIIAFGMREVIIRGFYAIQETKIPMINAAIGMTLNIILNIILSKFLGIGGLALATSISAIFTTILLFYSYKIKVGSLGAKHIITSIFKMLGASIIMGFIARTLYNNLINHISQNISFIISILAGALIYFIIIYFSKIKDIDIITSELKRKLRGNFRI